jgi:hypothetical protein
MPSPASPAAGVPAGETPSTGDPAARPTPGGTAASRAGRWSLARVGYLLVALFAAWFVPSYLLPSPVGLWVPAIPYLLVALTGAALVLGFALVRPGHGPRWLPSYRSTVVVGAAVGIGVAAIAGLTAGVALGCPTLPPPASLVPKADGWEKVPAAAWSSDGRPVLYFFGAVWCPYCSASSWAIWKALTELGSVSGNVTSYSYGPPEPYPDTPEMVLANAAVGPKGAHGPAVDFQVSEYNGTTDGAVVAPATCAQHAYVAAYSGGNIPFLVIGGQYLHIGSLYSPANLSSWNRTNDPNGAAYVERSVADENGTPWATVRGQAWWILALVATSDGYTTSSVAMLAADYGWSTATEQNVSSDLSALGS